MSNVQGQRATVTEQGSVTVWILGLCLMVLLVGGISLDLWRAFSERRSLAAAADAAAIAGASAIDTLVYRSSNLVQLVPGEAEQRARASLAGQLDRRALHDARVSADTEQVTVLVTGSVDFTLLGLLGPGGGFDLRARATAHPEAVR